jgi:ABC-type transport system involved in multi-copper enzyme maturation permease subunit
MIFLPIVGRELRVAARRRATYAIRFFAVLAAVALGLWGVMVLAQSGVPPAAQGGRLFTVLATLAFAYCLLIGAVATADCVSEEKREDTLGLLFLTDLKGYDVVLGKLVANSLSGSYGLLAILPVLAIPLMLGGVTGREFWLLALVLLNTMFLSLSVGIFVSSISRDDRKAMFATGALLLALTAGPAWVFMLLDEIRYWGWSPEEFAIVLVLSPGFSFGFLRWPGLPLPLAAFWWSVILAHLLGWMFLLRACVIVPRVWQDRAPGWFFLSVRRCLNLGHDPGGKGRTTFRRRHLGWNPFFWLAVRNPLRLYYVWGFVVAMVLGWWMGYYKHGEIMLDGSALIPTFLVFHAFLKVWFASEASSRLCEDRNSGALELLLSTPLGVKGILRGQWLALRQQFLLPVLAVLALETGLLTRAGSIQWIGSNENLVPLCVAGMIMLIADLFTFGWVGMWFGLTARSHHRAILNASSWVLVLPWVLFEVVVHFWDPGANPAISRDELVLGQAVLWVVIGLVIDGVLAFGWARPRLRHRFREVALQRYPSKGLLAAGSRIFLRRSPKNVSRM